MRVALGTLEISDEDRKKIGKSIAGSSYLKRDQAKEWALGLIQREIDVITSPGTADSPITAPKDADSLPEPAPAATPSYVGSGV